MSYLLEIGYSAGEVIFDLFKQIIMVLGSMCLVESIYS